jgi:hypothetical protein
MDVRKMALSGLILMSFVLLESQLENELALTESDREGERVRRVLIWEKENGG